MSERERVLCLCGFGLDLLPLREFRSRRYRGHDHWTRLCWYHPATRKPLFACPRCGRDLPVDYGAPHFGRGHARPAAPGGAVEARVETHPAAARWCRLRYPGHPKGCPNFGQRDTCPPQAPPIGQVIDLAQPVWLVWNTFDLGGYAERMRQRHPDWSERQLRCCLYWQGTARKELRKRLDAFMSERFGFGAFDMAAVQVPEAHGVDLTLMMARIGIYLWPLGDTACQVALVGTRKRRDP